MGTKIPKPPKGVVVRSFFLESTLVPIYVWDFSTAPPPGTNDRYFVTGESDRKFYIDKIVL